MRSSIDVYGQSIDVNSIMNDLKFITDIITPKIGFMMGRKAAESSENKLEHQKSFGEHKGKLKAVMAL